LTLFPPAVFGRGKTQEEAKEPLNKEWTLCISAFDASSMPRGRQFIGDTLARDLVHALDRVERRERTTGEYAYYEGAAWSRTKAEAAKNLQKKRDERDLLLFKGDPEWKYRRQLSVIEEEIKKYEEAMAKAERENPPVAGEPALLLTESSRSGSFPLPPREGEEFSFCVNQKADALLMGEVFEYHGRINLNIKLYALYARSFVYEDTLLFSPEFIDSALTELANRLAGEVSGTQPALVAVKTDPDGALITIQNSFAALGDTGVLEYPPGQIEVEAFAEDHAVVSLPLDLNSGELAEVHITLPEVALKRFEIRAPDTIPEGGSLYRGALYIGEAPQSVLVPQNQYEYIHIENSWGRTAAAAFSADPNRTENLVTLIPSRIRFPDEKRVEEARHAFYGSWGRFWIALPLTVLLWGISDAYAPTVYGQNSGLYLQSSNQLLHRSYLSIGALAATIVFGAEWVYRSIRYISTASEDAVPVVK
jgi:hypothetical protein